MENLTKICKIHKLMIGKRIKLENSTSRSWKFFQNFNKAVGLEKNPKLINVGSTFIRDSRVSSSLLAARTAQPS